MQISFLSGSFREVPLAEQREINGGALHFFVLIGAAAVTQIIIDWDNFKNGLMGRPEEISKS